MTAVALGVASTVGADDDGGADVKVATFVDGRCGKLEDSLPVLISSTGVQPGEVAGDVTVCVANTGSGRGPLSLRALELVDVDPVCTGEEAGRDPTCGGGKRGELSPSLVHQTGVGACPSVLTTSPTLDRRLPALQASSLTIVDRLRRHQIVCVRLRLRYDPAGPHAAVVSQSDRSTWRYVFTLRTSGDG